MRKKLVVIGAGASGLAAGIEALRFGAEVTILERNDRAGRKLSATGNGRCNFSNLRVTAEDYRGTDPAFTGPALWQYSVGETIDFFSRLGISAVERDGGLYPRSMQASSVTDALVGEFLFRKGKLKTNERVIDVTAHESGGFSVRTEGWEIGRAHV